MKQLSRLRLIFIIYFLVKIIIDIAAGDHVTNGITSYLTISPKTYYTLAIGANFILLFLGLLLFYFLLERRNWARIILLIIGWLAILDFFSSLLFSAKGIELLTRIDPATNWNTIMQIDRVTDFIGLLFWGYAIYILQFNTEVKQLFLRKTEAMKPKEDETN